MINLSRKTADAFKQKWADLPERTGDYWKVDLAKLGRTQILLIVHETTLATLVRRKTDFKTLESIAQEIQRSAPWYKNTDTSSYGRNSNRSLNGTLTDMKNMSSYRSSIDEIEQLEEELNRCPFSYLSEKKNSLGLSRDALAQYLESPEAALQARLKPKTSNQPFIAPKGFSDEEIANINAEIEKHIWSKYRPPIALRDQVREGQQISGYSIDLFLTRPRWDDPSKQVQESIARITYVNTRKHWKIFWHRADGKWHLYPECPHTQTLPQALQVIKTDQHHCFWG